MNNFIQNTNDVIKRPAMKMTGLAIGTFMTVMPVAVDAQTYEINFNPAITMEVGSPYMVPTSLNGETFNFAEATAVGFTFESTRSDEGLSPTGGASFLVGAPENGILGYTRVGLEAFVGLQLMTEGNKNQFGFYGLGTAGVSNRGLFLLEIDGEKYLPSRTNYGYGVELGVKANFETSKGGKLTVMFGYNANKMTTQEDSRYEFNDIPRSTRDTGQWSLGVIYKPSY